MRPQAPEPISPALSPPTGSGSRHPNPAWPATTGRWLTLAGLVGLPFVITAAVVEVMASEYASSSVPAWWHWVPLTWPQPVRVLWWLAVAVAAAWFRWSLARLGLPTRRVVTILTVGPFVVFAAGIAAGADWATWH